MGNIKDIVDLTTQLINSTQDRKLAAEISQIQSLILAVQGENASLLTENLDLKKKISELENTHLKKISELVEKHNKEKTELTEEIKRLEIKLREPQKTPSPLGYT